MEEGGKKMWVMDFNVCCSEKKVKTGKYLEKLPLVLKCIACF